MPLCIAGMPHSGMALVSRLLSGIGLNLGPIHDEMPSPDAEGRFARLNDEILHAVDAAWDSPPPRGSDWCHASELEHLRRRAAALADALGLSEPWGWADPRNSLTLGFWQDLFPDLRLLVCVRDPREVAAALHAGGELSLQKALSLWENYYGTLLDFVGQTWLVTDYHSFRDEPRAELERLARGLGLDSRRNAIVWTAAGLEAPITAPDAVDGKLPSRLQELYDRLLEVARSVPPEVQPAQDSEPGQPSRGRDDLTELVAAQRRELVHLQTELARAGGYIDALRTQVMVRSNETGDLRDITIGLEEQLVERDEDLEKLRKELGEISAWAHELEVAGREAEEGLEALRGELELIKSTRLWRTGQRYWASKERLRKLLGRSS